MHLVVASTTTWYAARAGGVVAYLLVSASVLAGILLAGKRKVPGLPRFAVEDVHRFLGLLAGLFIATHVASVALDTVVPFSLSQLIVPFTAGYRPLATGLGVVAMELLVAVAVTNRLRSRLPYRLWRRAHYATLAVWLLATVHGILSGSDRSQTWLLALYGTTVALVAVALVLRFGRSAVPKRLGLGLAAGVGALALVLGLSAFPQQVSSSKSKTVATVAVPELVRQPDRDDPAGRRLGHRLDQRHGRCRLRLQDRPADGREPGCRQRPAAALRGRHDLRGHADRARRHRLHRHVLASRRRHPHGDLELDGVERHRRRNDLDNGRRRRVGRRLAPHAAFWPSQ